MSARRGWKLADLKAAVAFAEESGYQVRGYTVAKDGAITVLTAPRDEPQPAAEDAPANPWDRFLRGAA